MGVGLARRCVVSNLGNMEIEQGKDASNFNCLAVCVEGGPVTRVENIMMHDIVSNVNVKGMRNLRVVVKTLTFEALKHEINAQRD